MWFERRTLASLVVTVSLLAAGAAFARPMSLPKPPARLVDVVMQQAQEMNDAVLDEDYTALADFMYPRVLVALGGRAAVIRNMQNEMLDAAEEEYGVTAIRVLTATEPVEAGNELHSVVTCLQYMKAPGVIFRARTYLIASSSDAGETWKFLNVPKRNPELVKSIFPVWNPELQIPTPPAPEPLSAQTLFEPVAK
ncbi:MAG TPA: hypothetical protein VJR89_11115 [Polyangiales bacterium]|nr:hypothetical protein [Polyangiales bacterium]